MPDAPTPAPASAPTGLRGVAPITGRLEPWMADVLADHAGAEALLAEHGSPVNLVHPAVLPRHADELVAAARGLGVDLRVFFARKANKVLGLVDAALAAGHGVDVASERELEQVLARGAAPDRVIVSAAVKPVSLLTRCLETGVVVSIDNLDELERLVALAAERQRTVPVALRLTADLPPPAAESRFGLPAADLLDLLDPQHPRWRHLRLVGLHFHLHGYAAADRSVALGQALDLLDEARERGHAPEFVDIGGGIPMRYLDDADQWDTFWQAHRDGLATGTPLTWEGHPLEKVYPLWQDPVRGSWLVEAVQPHALRLARSGVRLHAEPGRCLLDGAGLTLARVEHRKQRSDGTWLVGLAMNRTQCRSAADDFLLDPVLLPAPGAPRSEPGEGYLVGAYCIEAELLTWRRMVLEDGVAVGDVVAFVNTAGYQMHILESASHQIPLARNLVPDGEAEGAGWVLDRIDR